MAHLRTASRGILTFAIVLPLSVALATGKARAAECILPGTLGKAVHPQLGMTYQQIADLPSGSPLGNSGYKKVGSCIYWYAAPEVDATGPYMVGLWPQPGVLPDPRHQREFGFLVRVYKCVGVPAGASSSAQRAEGWAFNHFWGRDASQQADYILGYFTGVQAFQEWDRASTTWKGLPKIQYCLGPDSPPPSASSASSATKNASSPPPQELGGSSSSGGNAHDCGDGRESPQDPDSVADENDPACYVDTACNECLEITLNELAAKMKNASDMEPDERLSTFMITVVAENKLQEFIATKAKEYERRYDPDRSELHPCELPPKQENLQAQKPAGFLARLFRDPLSLLGAAVNPEATPLPNQPCQLTYDYTNAFQIYRYAQIRMRDSHERLKGYFTDGSVHHLLPIRRRFDEIKNQCALDMALLDPNGSFRTLVGNMKRCDEQYATPGTGVGELCRFQTSVNDLYQQTLRTAQAEVVPAEAIARIDAKIAAWTALKNRAMHPPASVGHPDWGSAVKGLHEKYESLVATRDRLAAVIDDSLYDMMTNLRTQVNLLKDVVKPNDAYVWGYNDNPNGIKRGFDTWKRGNSSSAAREIEEQWYLPYPLPDADPNAPLNTGMPASQAKGIIRGYIDSLHDNFEPDGHSAAAVGNYLSSAFHGAWEARQKYKRELDLPNPTPGLPQIATDFSTKMSAIGLSSAADSDSTKNAVNAFIGDLVGVIDVDIEKLRALKTRATTYCCTTGQQFTCQNQVRAGVEVYPAPPNPNAKTCAHANSVQNPGTDYENLPTCQAACNPQPNAALCGNGVRDPGEACDDGKFCENTWTPCTNNPDACAAGVACVKREGNGCSRDCTRVTTACNDGVNNNDGDDLVDFDDPGCYNAIDGVTVPVYDPTDDDESDAPEGPQGEQPQCADNLDNDLDNNGASDGIDDNDPQCHWDGNILNHLSYVATWNNEAAQAPPPVPITQCNDGLDNDGDGLRDAQDPACHDDLDPNDGDDSYREAYNTERLQCNDFADNDNDLKRDIEDPGCHVNNVINQATPQASYRPNDNTEVHVSSCPNGLLDEQVGVTARCDDGNENNGDGCSQICFVEHGWYCEHQPSRCETRCGDGIVAGFLLPPNDDNFEQCDDGNNIDDDRCSNRCRINNLAAPLDAFYCVNRWYNTYPFRSQRTTRPDAPPVGKPFCTQYPLCENGVVQNVPGMGWATVCPAGRATQMPTEIDTVLDPDTHLFAQYLQYGKIFSDTSLTGYPTHAACDLACDQAIKNFINTDFHPFYHAKLEQQRTYLSAAVGPLFGWAWYYGQLYQLNRYTEYLRNSMLTPGNGLAPQAPAGS